MFTTELKNCNGMGSNVIFFNSFLSSACDVYSAISGKLAVFLRLSLGENRLTGLVPSLLPLESLMELVLRGNRLTGPFPTIPRWSRQGLAIEAIFLTSFPELLYFWLTIYIKMAWFRQEDSDKIENLLMSRNIELC